MIQKYVRLAHAYKQTDTRSGTEGFEMIDTASSRPVPKGLIIKKKMKNESEGRCGIWAIACVFLIFFPEIKLNKINCFFFLQLRNVCFEDENRDMRGKGQPILLCAIYCMLTVDYRNEKTVL